MPLTLVTDAGDAAVNAFADLVSVQALAAYRGASGTAFLDLSPDQQVSAIASAAAEIDSFVITSATLAGASSFPLDIVRANRELAIARASLFADGATADPLTPTVDRVKRDKTGPLETEYRRCGVRVGTAAGGAAAAHPVAVDAP
jgi:hypothetical protein